MATSPPAPARQRTWHDLAPLIAFVAVFAKALRPLEDPDAFWHLATGRLMWHTHVIPKYDPFSWSGAGRPWVAHEWLTESILWPLWKVGGDPLLIVLFAAIVAATFSVVRGTAEQLGAGRFAASGFSFLAAFASAHTFNVRPQMLSLLFTAVLARPLLTAGHTKRTRLWMVPLMGVWANMHGGFFLGLVLLAVVCGAELFTWLAGRRSASSAPFPRHTLLVTGACVAATLANPNTVEGLRYPLRYLHEFKPMMRYIAEWARPALLSSTYLPFTALLLCTPLLAFAARRRPNFAQFGLLAVVTALALTAVRNLPVFCVVVTPLAAAWCTAGLTRSQRKGQAPRPSRVRVLPASIGAVAMSATLLGGAGIAATGVSTSRQIAEHADLYPSATLSSLGQAVDGRVFNAHDFGGWLIWKGVTVSIDGRSDMYGPELFLRYIANWSASPGWQQRLREDDVAYVLVEPAAPIAVALRTDTAWRLRAADPVSVLFERR